MKLALNKKMMGPVFVLKPLTSASIVFKMPYTFLAIYVDKKRLRM